MSLSPTTPNCWVPLQTCPSPPSTKQPETPPLNVYMFDVFPGSGDLIGMDKKEPHPTKVALQHDMYGSFTVDGQSVDPNRHKQFSEGISSNNRNGAALKHQFKKYRELVSNGADQTSQDVDDPTAYESTPANDKDATVFDDEETNLTPKDKPRTSRRSAVAEEAATSDSESQRSTKSNTSNKQKKRKKGKGSPTAATMNKFSGKNIAPFFTTKSTSSKNVVVEGDTTDGGTTHININIKKNMIKIILFFHEHTS